MRLHKGGTGILKIGKALGIGTGTVQRVLMEQPRPFDVDVAEGAFASHAGVFPSGSDQPSKFASSFQTSSQILGTPSVGRYEQVCAIILPCTRHPLFLPHAGSQ